MIDGRQVTDAHMHVPRLSTVTPAWLDWAEQYGKDSPWRTVFDADGDPVPARLDALQARADEAVHRTAADDAAREARAQYTARLERETHAQPNRRPNARPKPRTGSRSSYRSGLHRLDSASRMLNTGQR